MTVRWAHLPYDFLDKASAVISQIPAIRQVTTKLSTMIR
ncbi:MAG TPA: hypothetical protein DIW43_17815 [Spongiibacteraceae bacterium]|nr:hypothetical protein [Spongiibacteraceae bacterium]